MSELLDTEQSYIQGLGHVVKVGKIIIRKVDHFFCAVNQDVVQ